MRVQACEEEPLRRNARAEACAAARGVASPHTFVVPHGGGATVAFCHEGTAVSDGQNRFFIATLGVDEPRGVAAVQYRASPSAASMASWFAGPGRPEVRHGRRGEQPRLVSEAVTTRLTHVVYAITQALCDLCGNVRRLAGSGAPAASSATSSACSEDLQTLVASTVTSDGLVAIGRCLEELEGGMTGMQRLNERCALLAVQIGACTERVSSVDNQLTEMRCELQALRELRAEQVGGADGAAKDVTAHLGSQVEGLQSEVRALHEKAQATPDIQKVSSQWREVFQGAMSRPGSELAALQVDVGPLLRGSRPCRRPSPSRALPPGSEARAWEAAPALGVGRARAPRRQDRGHGPTGQRPGPRPLQRSSAAVGAVVPRPLRRLHRRVH